MIGTRYIDDTEYITLYYVLNDLFNKVSTFSLYKLQAMEEEMDKFAITESERDFFNVNIKRATRDVFKKFSVMSKGIPDALQFKLDDVASTSSYDESLSVVYIIDTPTYWDDNMTEALDQKVEEALISHVLKDWFKLRNLRDIYGYEKSNYNDLLTELRALVNYRTQAAKLTYRSL